MIRCCPSTTSHLCTPAGVFEGLGASTTEPRKCVEAGSLLSSNMMSTRSWFSGSLSSRCCQLYLRW